MRPVFILLLLGGQLATANTNPPPLDVTSAVALGVDYLRAQADKDADGWIFPAMMSHKIIGWTTNTVRYKEVETIIPGYQYERYEILVPGATPGEPMRKQTASRVIGRDPSKDQKITQQVVDKNGPIVREVPTPLYEKESGRHWRYGTLGNNGLAIVALRRCGIAGTDPLVDRPAAGLARLVTTFGMPDCTHDLAGITAGFAVMPGDDYKRLTEQCAAKLMDAQIATGRAAGLWGPVATSPAMLSAYLKVINRLTEEKKALSGVSKGKAKHAEAEIKKIEDRLADLQTHSDRITQFGLKLYGVFGHWNQGRDQLTFQGDLISVHTWPYLGHNQTTADLESTAEAIFALRVAFENGRLPAQTWRPAAAKPAGPGVQPPQDFPPARTARDVIESAIRAVTAARPADGRWSELNLYQPVTDFTWLKDMLQVKPELFPKLPSPVTLSSITHGAATLALAQSLMSTQARNSALENPACQTALATTNTYDAVRFCIAPRNMRGKTLRTDYTTWNDVAGWLTRQVNTAGCWGRTNSYHTVPMPSTSILALRDTIPPMKYEDITSNYDKPHISPNYFSKLYWPPHYSDPEATYYTTCALLFLADGLP